MEPKTLPNLIFKCFFWPFFSYCKFASIFHYFFMYFACFFKSRPSNFMRPRSVSWPSTPFRVFRKNHQKSPKNPPKILPKPLPKPRKIDPKSKKIVEKTQDGLRCLKKPKKLATRTKNEPRPPHKSTDPRGSPTFLGSSPPQTPPLSSP